MKLALTTRDKDTAWAFVHYADDTEGIRVDCTRSGVLIRCWVSNEVAPEVVRALVKNFRQEWK